MRYIGIFILALTVLLASCATAGSEAGMESLNRGLEQMENGEYEAAIASFTDTIRRDPTFAGAFNSRGTAYMYMGNFERAISDFNEAIRLAPSFVNAMINRANVYRHMEDFEQAITSYNEIMRISPNNADLFYSRGLLMKQ